MKKTMLFFYISIYIIVITVTKTACQNILLTKSEEIFILSDDAATYQNAQERCRSYEGELAQISSLEDRNFFMPHLQQAYINDLLTSVEILTMPSTYLVGSTLYAYDSYKYRSSVLHRDVSNILGFASPVENTLKSFLLSTRRTDEFSETVRFCWYSGRDMIRTVCNFGWNDNFVLYGASPNSKESIPLYNYFPLNATSKLSLQLITNDTFGKGPSIYLSDISVFIGAQSQFNESNWFWRNGSRIVDSTFPTANRSLCQQIVWPLTYNDGINLRSKECGAVSQSICQMKVSLRLEEVACNANALRLKFPTIIAERATIQVFVSTFRVINVPLNKSQIIIDNLSQQTNYSFQIHIEFRNCATCSKMRVTAKGRTGYGTPGPVLGARVINSILSSCVIAWKHSKPTNEGIEYQIIARSDRLTSMTKLSPHLHPDAYFLGGVAVQEIDLTHHGFNNTVTFQIQAITSCGVRSALQDVKGSCSSPVLNTELPMMPRSSTTSKKEATTLTTHSNGALNISQKHLSIAVWTLIALIGVTTVILLIFIICKRLRLKNQAKAITQRPIDPIFENNETSQDGQANTSFEKCNPYDSL